MSQQPEYVPVFSTSPSVYKTSFDSNISEGQDHDYRKKRRMRPTVRLARSSVSDSEMTCVGQESHWGEQKRVWISAEEPCTSSARRRTLILCFDGTGDQFDSDNSNVVQFLATLKKDDNSKQLVYYQAGIGTYTDPLFSMPVSNGLSLVLDQMLAWNLPSHVKDGYAFLMQNYTQGDKICIFGFSRGAYTARALAGMLHKVGLLPICNHQQLPFAYEMYAREDEEGLKLSHLFKKTFCRAVSVEFLGVWDTVASVGVIPRYLPFIHENTGIRYLRHALALDERRVKFLPQFCVDSPKTREKLKAPQHHLFHRQKKERARTLTKAYEDLVNDVNAVEQTDVLEVWFAGVHTDVGGGSVPNGTRHSLARIPLRWMVRECFRCNTGIIFDAAQLQAIGLRVTRNEFGDCILGDLPPRVKVWSPRHVPHPKSTEGLGSMVTRLVLRLVAESLSHGITTIKRLLWSEKRTLVSLGNNGQFPALVDFDATDKLEEHAEDYEAQEELEDAMSPFYDQLEARATWHILEWIPQRVKRTKAIIHKWDDKGFTWLWNRGQGRQIPRSEMKEGLKIHRSVKTRLEATERLGIPYVPQVRPKLNAVDSSGKKVKCEARSLSHEEWNVDEPVHWQWVE